MKILQSPFLDSDLKAAYELYSKELRPIIDDAFGWDEDFQRQRFFSHYEQDWFRWIEEGEKRIGLVCFAERDEGLHVHLLIVEDDYKGKGYGKAAMLELHKLARNKKLSVKLSTFKNNLSAIAFYKKLGYEVINEDQHFLDLRNSRL